MLKVIHLLELFSLFEFDDFVVFRLEALPDLRIELNFF